MDYHHLRVSSAYSTSTSSACQKLWCFFHNETVNIWTHLLPFIYSCVVLVWDNKPHLQHWLNNLTLANCLLVFGISTLAHATWQFLNYKSEPPSTSGSLDEQLRADNVSIEEVNPFSISDSSSDEIPEDPTASEERPCGKIIFFLDWIAILCTIQILEIILIYACFHLYEYNRMAWLYYIAAMTTNVSIMFLKFYWDFRKEEAVSLRKQYLFISLPNMVLVFLILGHAYIADKSFLFHSSDIYWPFLANQIVLFTSVSFHLIAQLPESIMPYLRQRKWITRRALRWVVKCGHSHQWWHICSSVYLLWNYYQIKNWDRVIFGTVWQSQA